jgi:Ca2+-binding RTX toxin-like protein
MANRVLTAFRVGLGDDHLDGGEDEDTVSGGEGADRIDGGTGSDTLSGGGGVGSEFDMLTYASRTRPMFINFEDGSAIGPGERDSISSFATVIGGAGSDHMVASDRPAFFLGGDGNDTLIGGNASEDSLFGEGGNDLLLGGDANDYLEGSAGDDTLHGNGGADGLFGMSGNDRLFSTGDNTADTVRGGSGTDLADADDEDDVLAVETIS